MAKSSILAVPAVGEVFELTHKFRGDTTEMLRRFGRETKDWKCRSGGISGPRTRRFMIIEVDYHAKWDQLIQTVSAAGDIPSGEWMDDFLVKYPHSSDGIGPIGIPDCIWEGPTDGRRFFPSADADDPGELWRPNPSWTHDGCRGEWRMIVAVKK